LSRKDRDEALKKQMENLASGKYGKSFEDLKDTENKKDEKYKEIVKKSNKEIIPIDINLLFPAPIEWNFFPQISDDKMLEMVFSIMANGLFNPIIVWEKEKNKYMILSGHNRVKAYKIILKEYFKTPGFDVEKYKTIPAIIYGKNEIKEAKAREIIIDTNYIQRGEERRIIPQIIKNRMEIIKERKDVKGRTIWLVAEEMGLSRTKVYEDQLIATRIIPELGEFYFNYKLKKKALLRFAWFDEETQKWIYENFKDDITDENVMKLKKKMDREQIRESFEDKNHIKKTTMYIAIPEYLKNDFKEMVTRWLTEKKIEQKKLSLEKDNLNLENQNLNTKKA